MLKRVGELTQGKALESSESIDIDVSDGIEEFLAD